MLVRLGCFFTLTAQHTTEPKPNTADQCAARSPAHGHSCGTQHKYRVTTLQQGTRYIKTNHTSFNIHVHNNTLKEIR